MLKKLLLTALPIAVIALLTSSTLSDNGRAGRTGSPGESTCTGCHSDFAINTGGGSVTIQNDPAMTGWEYVPGTTYHMSVTVARGANGLFGVDIEALTAANDNAGTLTITNAAATQIKTNTISGIVRRNVVHQLNGGASSGSKVFIFDWTAPAAGTGTITFYFTGAACDADGSEAGDYIYSGSQAITELSCVTPAQPGTITGNATVCAGASATYSIASVSGATSYTWTLPSGWTGTSTTTSITATAGTSGGNISVTANNSCGSSPARTLAVSATVINATTTGSDVTCNGANNGSATVNPSGGTSPYTYAWSPSGGTGATASNLSGGTYTVTVTDATGCTATATFSVYEPTALTGTTSATDATCGNANGTVTVSPSGGVSPYTYVWNTVPPQTTATATGLAAGTYDVTVTDDYGCTLTASATVNQNSTLSATTTQTDITCNGLADGTAIVTPAGGTAPYTYAWSPSGGTDSTATNLTAGNYTVTVTDNTGCSYSTAVTILEPDPVIADAGTPVVICEGTGSPIGGSPSASGGTGTYTYAWDPATALSSASDPNPVASPATTTDYTLTVTDANGCSSVATTTVGVNAAPTASITASGDTLYASSGSSYQWYFNTVLMNGETSAFLVPALNGDYTVVVTDGNGCSATSAVFTVGFVGIYSLGADNVFTVYPNPAATVLNVRIADAFVNSRFLVYDIAGQEMMNILLTERSQQVDVSSLARGMYTGVVENAGSKQMVRFAVLK